MNLLHRKEVQVIKERHAHNQEEVFQAVKRLRYPANGLAVAHSMGWDSASVTPRLAELVKKGRLRVAYKKKGLDGVWRQFYAVEKN